MSMAEFLDEAALNIPFQVFATDISETAIEKARAGIYTQAALAPDLAEADGAVLHEVGSRLPDRQEHP